MPEMDNATLSIVIPVYNESKRLAKTLSNLKVADLDCHEVIVVFDGCTDNSLKVAMESDHLPLKLISYEKNMGKGYAIKQGVAVATGDVIGFMDADGSADITYAPQLIEPIVQEQVDIVIGSRKIKGAQITPQPLHRQIMGRSLSKMTQRVLHMPFCDTQCGFKFFRKDVAKYLFGNCSSNGFEFDLEILHLAQVKKYELLEIPIKWVDQCGSKVCPVKDSLKMLKMIANLKMRENLLTSHSINRKYIWMLILFLLLARLAAAALMPLIDPTEGRYASTALEILNTGDWLTPQIWINGELVPFEGKPPLFFWCSAISMKIFGVNELAVRLPNIIALLLMLIFIWNIVRKYYGERLAFESVFLCISSVVLFVMSGTVIVDVFLMAAVSCALLSYHAFSIEKSAAVKSKLSIMIFIMLGVGFMTKGPIALVLFGLPVLIWTTIHKSWADLKNHSWRIGLIIFLALTLPWFVASEIKHPGFCKYFFINENLLRFLVHDYGDRYGSGHLHPRGSAIWMMMAAACPWSIVAVYLLYKNRIKIRFKQILYKNEESFFILAVLVTTVFWTMARQLLISYMLPMVPLFCIWLAIFYSKVSQREIRKIPSLDVSALICLVTAVLLVLSVFVMPNHKSAKGVLQICDGFSHGKANVYFLGKTPYSAHFYAPEKVINHPEILRDENMETLRDSVLYVIKDYYYEAIPEDKKDNLYVVRHYGKYVIFQVIQYSEEVAKLNSEQINITKVKGNAI